MQWYEPMVEANILRAVFILIIVWGYYETWKLNKLIGNRRLGKLLWKIAISIFLWVAGSLLAIFIQFYLDLETRILASVPTFLFFAHTAWMIRTRRLILQETWHVEQAEGNDLLNEVLDVLEIEKERAIREIVRRT